MIQYVFVQGVWSCSATSLTHLHMIGHLRLDNAQKKLRERSLVVQHPELFRNKVQEGAKNVAECSLRCDLPD